jgi:hypothetical protein
MLPNNDFIKTRFKRLKNIVTGLIRKHKKRHYTAEIELNLNNPRKLWRIFNTVIYNRDPNDHSSYTHGILDGLGRIVSCRKTMCGVFNQYFVGICYLVAVLQGGCFRPIVSTMRYSCLSSITALETDSAEINTVVKSLKNLLLLVLVLRFPGNTL